MVQWSTNVNTDFYALLTGVKPNVKKTTYESGRVKVWKQNETSKKTYTFSFDLHTKKEENDFWNWYNAELQCGAETVQLPDFTDAGILTEYLFTSEPSVEGQYPKKATVSVEEV